MDLGEEHYCVRWKGFQSNIVSALEDLKNDESFVDVTLSCDGETIQGHKVILSACSPYFKKILKDNPCRHPVLILNDIELEVLDALMTYMYNGTVSVPHNKLQTFLKTAEALKIKGIVDTGTSDDSAVSDTSVSPLVSPGPGPLLPPQVQELLGMSQTAHAHPAGDLSLLASAAIEQGSAGLEPTGNTGQHNNKRRKTAPRKLGSYLLNNSSHINRAQNNATMSVNGSDEENGGHSDRDTEKENNRVVMSNGSIRDAFTNGKLSAMNLAKPDITSNTFKTEKSDESLDLTVKSMLSQHEDSPQSPSPPSSSSHLGLLSSSLLPASGASPLNLLSVDGTSAADQMAALLGPDQMAALLGPSWKSRQPRMCQYCQRMFSNKFNLKQHILNMHTVGKELQCEICQKKVKNKWYLRRHHVTHHGAPLKK